MSSHSNQSPEMLETGTELMPDPAELSTMNYSGHTHNTAPTRFAEVGGIRFAYRRFGNPVGTPIVLFQHFMGNLDNYDPAITDALAAGREVILTDNAGVGLSTGRAPETVAGMAADAASLIDALCLKRVDLFGFSMGIRRPADHRRSTRARTTIGSRRHGPARRRRHGPARPRRRTAVRDGV